jgi:outer membrane protein OmpU
MNNLKKIGLTALAGSLAVTSAFAGELTATGSASMGVANITGTADNGLGKNFTMANSVYLAGSGELDNGMSVSVSFELDNGVDTGTGTGPFDNHYVEVGSDALGTLRFSGHGGSSAQGAMDTTAAGDLWNNTLAITGPAAAASGDNSLFYTAPALVDGVAITASLAPGAAATTDTHMSYGVSYSGIEGLTLNYGIGDSGTQTAEVEHTTISGSYAYGPLTVSLSQTEIDNAGSTADIEWDSYQVAYTVSENMSVTYGVETKDTGGQTTDEEVTGFGVSYTTGGMTISASQINAEGGGNVAAADSDKWSLTAAFAF